MTNLESFQQGFLKNVHLIRLLQILTVCARAHTHTHTHTHTRMHTHTHAHTHNEYECDQINGCFQFSKRFISHRWWMKETLNNITILCVKASVPPHSRQMALSRPVSASSISRGSSWLAKENTRSVSGPKPALCICVRLSVSPSEKVMVSWSGV